MAIRLKVEETKVKLKPTESDTARFEAHEGVPIYPNPYMGETVIEPYQRLTQYLPTKGLMMLDDIQVNPIPDEYIVPYGTRIIRENGIYDVTERVYAEVNVPVPSNYGLITQRGTTIIVS